MAADVTVKFQKLSSMMKEKLKRRWAACEAMALGRGGIAAVAEAAGMSRAAIREGLAKLPTPTRSLPRNLPLCVFANLVPGGRHGARWGVATAAARAFGKCACKNLPMSLV